MAQSQKYFPRKVKENLRFTWTHKTKGKGNWYCWDFSSLIAKKCDFYIEDGKHGSNNWFLDWEVY